MGPGGPKECYSDSGKMFHTYRCFHLVVPPSPTVAADRVTALPLLSSLFLHQTRVQQHPPLGCPSRRGPSLLEQEELSWMLQPPWADCSRGSTRPGPGLACRDTEMPRTMCHCPRLHVVCSWHSTGGSCVPRPRPWPCRLRVTGRWQPLCQFQGLSWACVGSAFPRSAPSDWLGEIQCVPAFYTC